MKSRVTVDTIGHGTVSPEQREYKRYSREVMTAIGLRQGFYDCGGPEKPRPEKRLSPERFSTNYKTREEFDKDRIFIADTILDGKYAPDDLVQKVAETVKELDLQLGD